MKSTAKLFFVIILFTARQALAQNEQLIFTSFFQGARDNCASVALLKSAMYKYGVGKVVTCQQQAGGIHVTLRNGQAVDLSNDELAASRAANGFIPSENADPSNPVVAHIFGYADTLYAVEAKYIATYGYSGCDRAIVSTQYNTYALALQFISKPGVCTDNVYKYLGLSITGGIQNYTEQIDFSAMKGVILYNMPHAIALYQNQGDGYGTLVPVAPVMKLNKFKFKPKWFIVLN